VAYAALEMLAANHYIDRPQGHRYYRVAWQPLQPLPFKELSTAEADA
jgi:hypothetical protein